MAKIKIYDAYPFIYAGSYSIDWKRYGMPLGGFRHLVDKVICDSLKGSLCLVVFDSKCTQEHVYREYKSNRKPNCSVLAQADMALDYLERLGISCFREDYIEADDVICAISEELSVEHSVSEIEIYTSDLDLAHCVNAYTKLKPANAQGKVIDANNFSKICSTPNKPWVMYNTISAYKVFLGCKSDTIKPMPNGAVYYEKFKSYLLESCSSCTGPDLRHAVHMYNFAKEMLLPTFPELATQEFVDDYVKRIELIFPKPYKNPMGVPYFELAKNSGIKDLQLARDIAILDNCKGNKNLLGVETSIVSQDVLADVSKRAAMLATGTFGANAGVPPELSILEYFGREF